MLVPESYAAYARIPEELIKYTSLVAGVKPEFMGKIPALLYDKSAVLIAYQEDLKEDDVLEAIKLLNQRDITVISFFPLTSIKYATVSKDMYYGIHIPFKATQKLRNSRKRALQDVEIYNDIWTKEHALLRDTYVQERNLAEGTKYIFSLLEEYLLKCPKAVLYSAWHKTSKQLEGFIIMDYTALATAFYMFAFRQKNAVPGTADALLLYALEQAEEKGYSLINLGLGINKGIEFFKHKYKAFEFCPYFESNFKQVMPEKKGFFSRLFNNR